MSITLVRLGGRREQPLLLLGPSLGSSVQSLWGSCARLLADDFQVVGLDLPGHGTARRFLPATGANAFESAAGTTMADLAGQVLDAVDVLLDLPLGSAPGRFHYAGDSVGGCLGLQLLLDAPHRVASAILIATGAQIGSPASWAERVATVRSSGTVALVDSAAERWFAPGFLARRPEDGEPVLRALAETDDVGYAAVCAALGSFDVRHRLAEIRTRVLTVAGNHDESTPPPLLAEIADGVADGRSVVLDGAAHLPPVELPEEVARLIREHALGAQGPSEPSPAPDGAADTLAAAVRTALAQGLTGTEVLDVVRRTTHTEEQP